MILTGTERYSWLARQSGARLKPRHVFVQGADLSLCTFAVRAREVDRWQPDPDREKCRVCVRRLQGYPRLQEVT